MSSSKADKADADTWGLSLLKASSLLNLEALSGGSGMPSDMIYKSQKTAQYLKLNAETSRILYPFLSRHAAKKHVNYK